MPQNFLTGLTAEMGLVAAPDWINGAPDDLRRWRNAQPEVVNPTMPRDVQISNLPPQGGCLGGLLFTPDTITGVPVVYFHGGGFIVGSPETHRLVAAWIAHITHAEVVSVRYRLAPEHPFPAQAEDAVAAVQRQLGGHPRLRLMGDSAGGMVALWGFAGLSLADRAAVSEVVLFYPGGTSTRRPANVSDDEADGLGPKSLASYQRRLDPRGIIAGKALYDPQARGFTMSAAMTILGAGADPLLYAAEALANRSGTRLIVAEGQAHGFLSGLPSPLAMAWLQQALRATP